MAAINRYTARRGKGYVAFHWYRLHHDAACTCLSSAISSGFHKFFGMRRRRLDRLESTGTVLGLFRDWDCLIEERALRCGDILAVYTDGVTEAFSDADEEFGEARLIDSLRRHRHLPAQGIISAVLDEVRQFSAHEQHDDITLTVAKCR
jgi:sigma-B regulation protein RsbU (phosphoserine phosphatase)